MRRQSVIDDAVSHDSAAVLAQYGIPQIPEIKTIVDLAVPVLIYEIWISADKHPVNGTVDAEKRHNIAFVDFVSIALSCFRRCDFHVIHPFYGAFSGQKPLVTKAKKSVANFKLREGMNIGCKVTLRGDRMYEFADRLINIALPRVRDFRGVKANSFDGRGNYTMGIKEQLIFPEIEYDKVDKIRGMDIVFVTTAKTDEEARELLRLFGMPFAK